MSDGTIRIGIIGLGGNARQMHVPGFRACENVEITAVCNRRRESTESVAREFGIPRTFERWEDLVGDREVDAVLIGTWPYLHCPITIAALAAGKHVMTEARMAMNAAEASRMLEASRARPDLVAQVVPSPLGLRAHRIVRQRLGAGFLGELREVVVLGCSDHLAGETAPLGWRQSAELSGVNMLSLGILHETLIRWVPDPVSVLAQTERFVPRRTDPGSGAEQAVGTPDSVQVLTQIAGGGRGVYHLSGVTRFGPGMHLHLYGSEGTMKYELHPHDRLMGGRIGDPGLREIPVPPEQEMGWRVEAEFIDAIRGKGRIEFTAFETGVRYMQFTEAVAQSARLGKAVRLPLQN